MTNEEVLRHHYQFVDEMYEVVTAIELVRNSTSYRLEIMKSYRPSETFYCARLMRLATAKEAKQLLEDLHPGRVRFFVAETLPWVNRPTKEQALRQALGFFNDKFAEAE